MILGEKILVEKSECCGCGSCTTICPVAAIHMKADTEGFLYPMINEQECIRCGLCKKTCSFLNRTLINKKAEGKIAYVAKHKEQGIRIHSRSGGLFVACSDIILDKGGVIYGCILDEDLKAKHICAVNRRERNRMCKSKYVQSDIEAIFNQVKKDLEEKRYVLFSGTGCQIDSMLSFLKQNKVSLEYFYSMDMICHGCVSPLIFKEYLTWIERKQRGKVTSFEFRDKSICGWDGHIESAVINGKKYKSVIYRELFYTNLCIRPSCYNCKYASVERNADITIGDAWGIKNVKPEFNDNKGVSLFLINSQKGQELLEDIRGICDIAELPLEKMMQPNLQRSSKPKGNRGVFWEEYYSNGIDGVIRKYGKLSLAKHFKANIKYRLRKILQSKKYYLP